MAVRLLPRKRGRELGDDCNEHRAARRRHCVPCKHEFQTDVIPKSRSWSPLFHVEYGSSHDSFAPTSLGNLHKREGEVKDEDDLNRARRRRGGMSYFDVILSPKDRHSSEVFKAAGSSISSYGSSMESDVAPGQSVVNPQSPRTHPSNSTRAQAKSPDSSSYVSANPELS
jgi:hypothetical protein